MPAALDTSVLTDLAVARPFVEGMVGWLWPGPQASAAASLRQSASGSSDDPMAPNHGSAAGPWPGGRGPASEMRVQPVHDQVSARAVGVLAGLGHVGHDGRMVARAADDAAISRLRAAVHRRAVQTAARARTGRSHEDADEVIGTADTDDAYGFDPLPLLQALHEHGARVVVMGQVAGIMHGSRELTGDLDLLWDGDLEQAPALAATFAAVRASLADADGVPISSAPAAFGLPKVLFRSPGACGDCCTPALPWGEVPVRDFLARCRSATAREGFEVRYVDRLDLIRMRRAVGRVKDLRRADELEHRGSGLAGPVSG